MYMRASSKHDLVLSAANARQRAVAPYSKFKVGAALRTHKGEIITGANVESASYGLTCCAERIALFNALTGGKRDFIAVAVVARVAGGAGPRGARRRAPGRNTCRAPNFFSGRPRIKGGEEIFLKKPFS